ncbi:O-antigen ligase family protein [Puerhibacterium puerhi]|uniref:O-antigen ligase family protein n=1 Tax=Puerhibacterium puerhi TaxID=2692623 RepID=UPI00135B029A|nr:O-antigen ligase family protein [Puerhibacterium puerhi]
MTALGVRHPVARAREAVVRRVLRPGVPAVLALVALVGVAVLVPHSPVLAVAVALVLLLVVVTLFEPAVVPVLAMPALIVVQRVGGDGLNLSLSDFALAAAFWPAVLLAPRPFSPPMRTLLWASAGYQAATAFTVLVNPYLANTVEWFHAWLSVGGALVVGWAVGRSGRARAGLTLFLLACVAVAVLAAVQGVVQLASGNTGPVYLEFPYQMHKNFIGCLLAVAALVAYARPTWVGWPRWFALAAFWLCVAGTAASQARQALVGLAVGVLVLALRPEPGRRRSRVIWLAALPALWFVVLAVQEQLASDNEFNSVNQRLQWYEDALTVWRRNPWFGMGLRWWTTGRTEFVFQPPNAELEMLSSAGLVGLVGFLLLFGVGLVALWRTDRRFGTLAFVLLLTRFVMGQFDLFWVAVQVSVPFVLVGLCLGAQEHARTQRRDRAAAAGAGTAPRAARGTALGLVRTPVGAGTPGSEGEAP